MEDYIKVGGTEDVKPGKMKSVREQGRAILLVNVDGEIYALSNHCTHNRRYLHHGKLKGKVLTCPCHFAKFDVTTGAVLGRPAKEPLPVYPVRVEGKDILVAI
jgi:3-phenylpropionate/trans-cinnamate dioxygenase ferredoxin subunit